MYQKNESDNDHKLFLHFFRIFSQHILGFELESWIRMNKTYISNQKFISVKISILRDTIKIFLEKLY